MFDSKAVHRTPKVSVQFASLLKTEVIDGKDTNKYSLTLILDPEVPADKAFIEAVEAINTEAVETEIRNDKKGKVSGYTHYEPFKAHLTKGDDDKLTPTGKLSFKLKSQYPIKAIGLDKAEVPLDKIGYGATVVASFTAKPFAMPSTKMVGATFYLRGVLMLSAGSSGGATGLEDLADELAEEFAEKSIA